MAEHVAVLGDDPDVEVRHEHADPLALVRSAHPEEVELRAIAKGERAGGVNAVPPDRVRSADGDPDCTVRAGRLARSGADPPPWAPDEPEVAAMLKDFKQFILRGNLVDLAVAVVMGAAFAAVVAAFVADFITPLIAAIFGKQTSPSLTFTVNHSTFHYGALHQRPLSFLIVAFVMFFFVITPGRRPHAPRRGHARGGAAPQALPGVHDRDPRGGPALPGHARRCSSPTAA